MTGRLLKSAEALIGQTNIATAAPRRVGTLVAHEGIMLEVSGFPMPLGSNVRIIRQPHFGEVAKVVSLPEKPVIIPSEAKVRVVEIQTASGEKFVLPRANVEIIEE